MEHVSRWLGIGTAASAQSSRRPSIKGSALRAVLTVALLCIMIVAGLRALHDQGIEDPLLRAGVCVAASALALIANWGMPNFQTRGGDHHA